MNVKQATAVSNFHDTVNQLLTDCVNHYEKSAPVVADWADGLYSTWSKTATMAELSALFCIMGVNDDAKMTPNMAQNYLVHQLDYLGKSTAGMIDH